MDDLSALTDIMILVITCLFCSASQQIFRDMQDQVYAS